MIVQAECYRHSSRDRSYKRSVITLKHFSCVFIKLEHQMGLSRGRRENGFCRVALSWTFSGTCHMSFFFFFPLTSVYNMSIMVLILHTRTPKLRGSDHTNPLREEVVEPGSAQTISETRWTRLGTDFGCLPFMQIPQLTSFLGVGQA